MHVILERLTGIGAIMVGWACLGLSGLIGFEILARKVFRFSVQGADELGGYVLAITAAFGFSYALVHRAHTRIDVLLGAFGDGVRAPLNLLSMLSIAGFAGFVAWHAWEALSESLSFGSLASTPLRTPLWIPQAIWVLGLAVFAAVALLFAAHAVVLFFTSRDRLNQQYGPLSLAEEIAEETSEETSEVGDEPAAPA